MTNTQEFSGVTKVVQGTFNGERRTKVNTGYGVYIGRKRVAWSISSDEALRLAIEAVKRERTSKRFVPPAIVFDQAQIVNIAVVTDDANGIKISRPSWSSARDPRDGSGIEGPQDNREQPTDAEMDLAYRVHGGSKV